MDFRLLCLAVGTFTISTVGFAFSGLLPSIASDTQIPVAQAGLVITAYSLAYAIGAPVLSAVAGTFDRRHLLCASMLVFVLGNLAAALSPVFAMLIAAQVVMGASAGLFVSTAQATAVSLAAPEHRARAVSLVFTGTTFAVALGAPLGSLIANVWNWRETFVCVAALGVVCITLVWLLMPRDLRGSKLSLSERLHAVGRPGIPSSLIVTMLYLAGGFVIIGYLAPLGMDGAGLSEMALPAILLSFGLGAVIGNLASGYLADRIGATRVIALTLGVSLVFCLLIALDVKLMPAAIAGPLLIGMMFPWGVIGWAFPPAQASRLAGFAPEVAHLTLSLNVSALYFGIAFGTVVGGRVLEYAHASDLSLVAAIFPVVALAVLMRSERALPARISRAAA